MLEDVIVAQAVSSFSLDRLISETPSRDDLTKVANEVVAIRKMVLDHIEDTRQTREALQLRCRALLDILQDVLARMPP
jgi:hypothetical protein